MDITSPLNYLQVHLTNLALNGVPLVAIILLLLTINQIFLHLLALKSKHGFKRKH